MLKELDNMSFDDAKLVVKTGVVATEAALMFDVIYVLAYALQKLEDAGHPVHILFSVCGRVKSIGLASTYYQLINMIGHTKRNEKRRSAHTPHT